MLMRSAWQLPFSIISLHNTVSRDIDMGQPDQPTSEVTTPGWLSNQVERGLHASWAVGRLLDHAVGLGASDLFVSAQEERWVVTVRHLGLIRPVCDLTPPVGLHCAAHLRAEAALDIAEHRKPQDGRWVHRTPAGKILDLRVSALPTLHGEDVSVRLLDRETSLLRLDQVGLLPTDLQRLRKLLENPGGLILMTGPIGAGKSTTLYACLQYLNDGTRRIHTLEDPIEYAIDNLHQSQVNPKHGVHFPDLLRCIIRQGPDVIMIGEIRDSETARTAVSAANSGHLVLATLHAPRAAGSVASMLAFGVEPHFLATSMIGAVSQRLVRTFCPKCRFPLGGVNSPGDPPTSTQTAALGCPACHYTGFGRQTALFEVMEMTPALRELVRNRETTQAIEAQAHREGMTGFRHAAEALVARGLTEMGEIERRIPRDCLQAGH
ncbi:MAG: ATPase [Planctomycetaceae bacterium]|nr:ATPase [Planctomycetaceae bacterium]